MVKAARDIVNRSRGFVLGAISGVSPDYAGDDVIEERVRAVIGRFSSHPRAILVDSFNGNVTIAGPVLAEEMNDLISAVHRVKGVATVTNSLEPHPTPENIPSLQGRSVRRDAARKARREQWSPAIRLIVGVAGAGLVLSALVRATRGRAVTGGIGIGLLLRAAWNRPVSKLAGIGSGPDVIHFRKTIHIDKPVERVFEAWSRFEDFPHYMRNVESVHRIEDMRSHWRILGPAGVTVEWNADITRLTPFSEIAWRTAPGSPVQHAGTVKFQPHPNGGTLLDIELSYNPGAGVLGHAVAKLFGADPKKEIDEDLVRMKTFLETGKTPRDAAHVE